MKIISVLALILIVSCKVDRRSAETHNNNSTSGRIDLQKNKTAFNFLENKYNFPKQFEVTTNEESLTIVNRDQKESPSYLHIKLIAKGDFNKLLPSFYFNNGLIYRDKSNDSNTTNGYYSVKSQYIAYFKIRQARSKVDNYLTYQANFLLDGHLFEIRQKSQTMDESYELFKEIRNDLVKKYALNNSLSLNISQNHFFMLEDLITEGSARKSSKLLETVGENKLCITYMDRSQSSTPTFRIYGNILKSIDLDQRGFVKFDLGQYNDDVLTEINNKIASESDKIKIITKCYNTKSNPEQLKIDLGKSALLDNLIYATLVTNKNKLMAMKFFNPFEDNEFMYDSDDRDSSDETKISVTDNIILLTHQMDSEAQSDSCHIANKVESLCSKYLGKNGETKKICYKLLSYAIYSHSSTFEAKYEILKDQNIEDFDYMKLIGFEFGQEVLGNAPTSFFTNFRDSMDDQDADQEDSDQSLYEQQDEE